MSTPTGSPAVELLKEIQSSEKSLKEFLDAKKTIKEPEVKECLQSICANYERLFVEHPVSSNKRQLETSLWKNVFYRIIEDYRKRLRRTADGNSLNANEKAVVSAYFLEFLKDSVKWYTGLNGRLCSRFPNDRITRVLYPAGIGKQKLLEKQIQNATPVEKNLSELAAQMCHRNCIYIGDLLRYYEQAMKGGGDYNRAISYYRKAMKLWSHSGNPLNQLAVVATYKSDLLSALTYYYQSLTVKQPFATTRENLAVLFQKNVRLLSDTRQADGGPFKRFSVDFIALHQAVFENKSAKYSNEYDAVTKQFEELILSGRIDTLDIYHVFLTNMAAIYHNTQSADCLVDMIMRSLLCMLRKCNRGRPADQFLPSFRLFWIWALQNAALVQDKIHSRLLGEICDEWCKFMTKIYIPPNKRISEDSEMDCDLAGFLPTAGWFEKFGSSSPQQKGSSKNLHQQSNVNLSLLSSLMDVASQPKNQKTFDFVKKTAESGKVIFSRETETPAAKPLQPAVTFSPPDLKLDLRSKQRPSVGSGQPLSAKALIMQEDESEENNNIIAEAVPPPIEDEDEVIVFSGRSAASSVGTTTSHAFKTPQQAAMRTAPVLEIPVIPLQTPHFFSKPQQPAASFSISAANANGSSNTPTTAGDAVNPTVHPTIWAAPSTVEPQQNLFANLMSIAPQAEIRFAPGTVTSAIQQQSQIPWQAPVPSSAAAPPPPPHHPPLEAVQQRIGAEMSFMGGAFYSSANKNMPPMPIGGGSGAYQPPLQPSMMPHGQPYNLFAMLSGSGPFQSNTSQQQVPGQNRGRFEGNPLNWLSSVDGNNSIDESRGPFPFQGTQQQAQQNQFHPASK